MVLKVLAPVAHPSEVEMVLGAGATEIYGGVMPRAWRERYSHAVWLSRRSPSANLPDLSSLAETVREAAQRGAGFHLALNVPQLTPDQLGPVAELASRAVRHLGVEAVIAADIALMMELGRRGVPFVASTVAVAHNEEAFKLFQDLGAIRAVLPRHLHVKEIAKIAKGVPSLPLEAFVLFDNCAYEEGLCRTQHDVGETGAFCQTPWRYAPSHADGSALTDAERAEWEEALAHQAEWLRWADACGHPLTDDKLPNGACGLCAIPQLADAGVTVLKLAGREASPYRKLRGVQLVARVVERTRAGATHEEIARLSQDLRATPSLCASGAMCYYPSARLPVVRD